MKNTLTIVRIRTILLKSVFGQSDFTEVYEMETNYRGDRLSEYNNIIKENDNIYRGLARNMGLSESRL